MFFKPKTRPEDTGRPEGGAVPLRGSFTFGIIQCALILLALAGATFAWINSNAWFANNRQVDTQDSSITSSTANVSLFISNGTGAVDNAFNTAIRNTWGQNAALFPISTPNCSNWWYASAFSAAWNQEGTAAVAKASAYSSASVTETNGVATYNNSLDGNGKVAYLVSDYKLYTNRDTLNVYLDPVNPITVSYGINNPTAKLLNALRVGVMVNGTLKFIYAPVAESGTGNSSGTLTANTFYAVTSASAVSQAANVVTSLSGYQATSTGDGENPYSAGTATSLGSASTSGLPVRVFVWLEGTDAQAILGESDGDTQGIDVSIKYVGVSAS